MGAPASTASGEAPDRPARGRPRVAELEAQILQACFAVLGEVGYARLSVDVVAKRAGVTRPTVYRRWPTKDALAVAALERAQSGIVELPDTGDLRGDLTAHLASLHQTLSRPNGMAIIGTMLAEEHTTPALLQGFRDRVVAARRQPMIAVLRRGLPGVARGDLELLVDCAVGAFYARYVAGNPFSKAWPRRTAEAVIRSGEALRPG